MQPVTFRAVTAAAALFATSFAAHEVLAANLKGESWLVRSEPAVDQNASGKVVVTIQSHDEHFRVTAKQLDPSLPFDLWMQDTTGDFVFFGPMQRKGKHFVFDVSASDGPLPLAAVSLDDYAGREMHIRSGGDLHLWGVVPVAVKSKGKKGFSKEVDALDLPEQAPDEDATGDFEVWRKAKDGRERIRVRVAHLDEIETYSVHFEKGVGSGTFHKFADLTPELANGTDTSFRWFLDTKNGDPLPFGANHLGELEGRAVQVRDGDGNVILEGVVPAIH